VVVHHNNTEPWKVTLIDTGLNTMTGGRIKRVKDYIGDETFMLTYGDGVSDVDIKELIKFHKSHGKIATMTAIQPGGRFGMLDINESGSIENFIEKSKEDGGWINGGFMVLEPEIIDYIEGDETTFERYPLETVAKKGQLKAYKHSGFWQCMDTLRDKGFLEKLWTENKASWKVW
jgi:glucose-1-phosphate cytidylyltransferase